MWYFTWIIGVFAAVALGIINVMWYEAQDSYVAEKQDEKPKA